MASLTQFLLSYKPSSYFLIVSFLPLSLERNIEMGFSKSKEKSRRVLRIVFFLISMIVSFLLFSAPVLFVIADTLLPSALLSASLSSPSPLSIDSLFTHLTTYDFRYSLIDIPLISILRSAIIIIVYSLCDGPRLSRGPYLGITTICSVFSLVFVSVKASYMFSDGGASRINHGGYAGAMEIALFVCSISMAVGHVIVAYRISCRERRKLLVYKIDIEAVSAWKIGFPKYQKLSPTRKSEVKNQK